MLSCLKVKLHILETITRYGQSQLTFTVNFCNLKDSSQITEQRPFLLLLSQSDFAATV